MLRPAAHDSADARAALKDKTIHIRIAGVDAPEAAHFGKEAQPGSELSLAWLKSQIEGRTLWCQLLRKDQYFRIVRLLSRTCSLCDDRC
jgi:endonuclease YncB( thermonuclease family)